MVVVWELNWSCYSEHFSSPLYGLSLQLDLLTWWLGSKSFPTMSLSPHSIGQISHRAILDSEGEVVSTFWCEEQVNVQGAEEMLRPFWRTVTILHDKLYPQTPNKVAEDNCHKIYIISAGVSRRKQQDFWWTREQENSETVNNYCWEVPMAHNEIWRIWSSLAPKNSQKSHHSCLPGQTHIEHKLLGVD